MKKFAFYLLFLVMSSFNVAGQQNPIPAERDSVLQLLCHSWEASHFIMKGKKMLIPPDEDKMSWTFYPDGSCTQRVIGVTDRGNYEYNHAMHYLTISTKGPRDQMKIISINAAELQLDMLDPEYPGLFVMKRQNAVIRK